MSRPTLSAKTSTASATKKPDNRRDILLAVSQGIAVLAGEFGIWYVMAGRDITIAIFLGFLFAAIIVPLAVREAYHRWKVGRILRQPDPVRLRPRDNH